MESTLYDQAEAVYPRTTDTLPSLGMTLDTTNNPHTIQIVQNTNVKFNHMVRTIIVEAVLIEDIDGVLVPSAAKNEITFTLRMFNDCSNAEGLDVLKVPTETKDTVFQIALNDPFEFDMIYPEFTDVFNDPISNPCTISVKLVTNSQPASLNSPPAYFTVGLKDPATNTHKLTYDVTSNNQVKIYDGDTLSCDLSIKGINKCVIAYNLEVIGLTNQTAAIQTTGNIKVFTECHSIIYRYHDAPTFASITHLGGLSADKLDSKLVNGYEVRDGSLTFNLPYFTPSLASGNNITQMCGPLEYTVTINSNKPGPYD